MFCVMLNLSLTFSFLGSGLPWAMGSSTVCGIWRGTSALPRDKRDKLKTEMKGYVEELQKRGEALEQKEVSL